MRQLRGFSNGKINRGKSVQVRFDLRRRDLSIWDTVAQKRQFQSRSCNVYVGSSSRNLPLMGPSLSNRKEPPLV